MKLGACIPFHKVKVTDPFWSKWQEIVIENSLPHQYEQCETTGRLENFRKAANREDSGYVGYIYNDSDVYKWSEAAAYAAFLKPESDATKKLKEVIDLVGRAQMDDGYLHTKYQLGNIESRYTRLVSDHEMYCGGHMIEAACALFEGTGDTSYLEIAKKYADHILATFGPDKFPGICGHQEIELALCRLADCTGKAEYRERANWMTHHRGSRPSNFEKELKAGMSEGYSRLLIQTEEYSGKYNQDDMPLLDQTKPVGHSVRAMYYYCGAIDACEGEVPQNLKDALIRIWRALIDSRMYVTGGIGSSHHNEGFTDDFDLPNREAYAETCAGIGLIFWAKRMNEVMGTSEPIDVLERVLYNAALSGIGMDGKSFYYDNPLESTGKHLRQPWFGCACCPPNIARLILSLGGYVARESEDGVTLNLLFGSEIETKFGTIKIDSLLPYEGRGRIELGGEGRYALRIRVPAWAKSSSFKVNGEQVDLKHENGYATLDSFWKVGDVVEFDFEAVPELLTSHPAVFDNHGRTALVKGPLVYCIEEADFRQPVSSFAVSEVRKGTEVKLDLPVKTIGLTAEGCVDVCDWPQGAPFATVPVKKEGTSAVFIPYFAWSNRTAGSMQIWVRRA